MIIAVYVSSLSENPKSKFIVGTFFPLFKHLTEHRFIIITNVSNNVTALTGFDTRIIKPEPANLLLKKLWIERSIVRLLKKINADLFISAGNFCSLTTSLPQILLAPEPEKLKSNYAKKVQSLIVINESGKNELVSRFSIGEDKIAIVFPSPGKLYAQINEEKKESIKNKYSEGKEYFLCNSNFNEMEELIGLLKSFSYFKKRQQSSFKLLLFEQPDFSFEKTIENYKYRNDIVIIRSKDIDAAITAAAYGVVLPFAINEDLPAALNAMQAGVPVITSKNSSINEIAGDGALYAETGINDIGEKMMQLYKDESLRSQLIIKGKDLVKKFTEEKSADQLRQSVMKAMN